MDALVLDGRYRIGERLGEGGMGAVWEAVDERLERQVAVKVMSGVSVSRDPRAKERFDREAKLLAGLASPYVVTVHDAGEAVVESSRLLYLVMERLHGRSLAEVVERELPTLDAVARWAEQICRALAVAHDAGVVHRDLKPANVMVCDDGLVRVLDFGIAAVLTENPDMARLTSTGLVVGTPAYMAPEQIESGSYDARSDLYALGCMLYELVVGRPPFEGDALYALMRQHMTSVPDLPSERRPGLPAEWDSLIMHLLAKEPDSRPGHASEVAQALRQLPRPEVEATPGFAPRGEDEATPPPGYEPTRIDPRMAMASPPMASPPMASPPMEAPPAAVPGGTVADPGAQAVPGFGPPLESPSVPPAPSVPPQPSAPPLPATPPGSAIGVLLAAGERAGPYPQAERLTVALGWTVAPDASGVPEVDGSALAVDGGRQVLSDQHFVFYNNLALPSDHDDEGQGILLEEYEHSEEPPADGDPPREHLFQIEPGRLDAGTERIVFALSLHEGEDRGHDLSMLAGASLQVSDGADGTVLCRHPVTAEALADGQGLIVGELYRTPQGWGFEAETRHFAEGLVEIAQAYGVNV